MSTATDASLFRTVTPRLPGLAVVIGIAVIASVLAQAGHLSRYGASALTVAIVLGTIVGNLVSERQRVSLAAGMADAQRYFLRLGVALFGLNLSVTQVIQVGTGGLMVDLVMVSSTLMIGYFVGTRLLGLDRHVVLLTTAGSAICGAAAVVATVPLLRADGEKTAAAVATVVIFGTLSMLIHPLIFHAFPAAHGIFGIFVGATVHEVAQVVAIGKGLGPQIANTAVIVKMIRVMLLVPFLLILSWLEGRRANDGQGIAIPWFAFAFIALAGVNSMNILPEPLLTGLRMVGVWLLTAAMAALGLSTTVVAMRKAGLGPLRLAALLFAHLVLVGGLVSWLFLS